MSSQGLEVCPHCGERLRQDWFRPVLIAVGLVVVVALVMLVGPRLLQGLEDFRPARAIGTVQAMVSEVPVLVEVPTLTPSLTPSITPSPTSTPTSTPTPSVTPSPTLPTLTPTPTSTPTATPTDTPSPTPTQTRRPATPTRPPPTPTSMPTVPAPALLEPEDGTSFGGVSAIIRLAWQSNHTLGSDECFLLTVSYVQDGSEVGLPMCLQETQWWVDEGLYLQADQETDRAYHWRVGVVREEIDEDGNVSYVSLGSASQERTFYWH